MVELTYDDKKHWYFIDGVHVPSVTQIISPLNDFSAIPAEVLQAKCDWGIKIDKMCELYLHDDLDYNLYTEAHLRVLEQFKSFLGKEGSFIDLGTVLTQYRGCNERLKFAGTADIIAPDKAIIDIKTRKLNPLTDPLQLIGYNAIYNPSIDLVHYILSLFEDRYEFRQINIKKKEWSESWSRFRYLLDKAWSDIEFKQKIKNWKKG